MLAVVVVLAVLAELAVLAVPGVAYADMNRDRCAKRRARAWRSRASRSLAIQVTGSAHGCCTLQSASL